MRDVRAAILFAIVLLMVGTAPGSSQSRPVDLLTATVAELQAKIDWCFRPLSDSTYIVGHGLLGDIRGSRTNAVSPATREDGVWTNE